MKSSPDVILVGRDSYDLEFLLGRLPHGSFFRFLAGKYLIGFLVDQRREITSVVEHKPLRAGFNHQERCSGAGIPVKGQKGWVVRECSFARANPLLILFSPVFRVK